MGSSDPDARDSSPRVYSLFESPLSDDVIIDKLLLRIESILGAQPRKTFPPGTRLTSSGEHVQDITLVLSGRVALMYETPSGNEIVMHEESTGRIIGLMAISEGQTALLNAVTTTSVEAVQLTMEQLNSAVEGNSEISLLAATLFIRSLDRRLRRAEELHITNAELSRQLETERRNLASALSNLEEARTELMAQERLASLGSLSAGVAHELNNPVAAIERVSEYLADDVIALLETAPDRKWAALAISALADGLESIALSSRQERELRKEFTGATGDGATAMRLALGGIRDPELARKAVKGSGIELESALQAASIGTGLRNLNSASGRITDLVSSLRSYARPDGDSIAEVNVNQSLEDSLRLLSHKLSGLRVVRDYDDVPSVMGYHGQLAQVWTNVLTNAAEAITEAAESSGENEGDLGSITVRTLSPRPGWVRVQIADDGPGVPPDVLPRIFEPRFTTKSGQVRFGMGIGLSVSRTIIGRHYGTMRIDTGESGTTVTVDIPTEAPKEHQ